MSHWLSPLLSPKSIALVGASERVGSLAVSTYQQIINKGYKGKVYPVNPKYSELHGQCCYSSLESLPAVPDLVVFAISGRTLEGSFDQAISIGVGGIVIYASNYLENDITPSLNERLRQKAKDAGIPVCGGNSMGFYNYDDDVFISFDHPPETRPKGHIGLIAHSGSGFTYLANNDERFCYNYVIASAQEINATVADYIDYLLEQESTRVIAVILEAVRDVAAFIAALKKSQIKKIPVLITKLARTEKSANLALSHSGAIVGNHDAFVAVCERYGVTLCRDIDEMIITAVLFSSGCHIVSGSLASILDSGGLREQMIDLADDYGVRFAEISDHSCQSICRFLDSGLEADNPLDAMGALANNVAETYLECGKALLDDPNTGLLTFEFEFRDGFSHYPELFEVVEKLSKYNHKPVVVLNSCTFASLHEAAAKLTQQGIPVINGIDVALRAIRHLFQYQPKTGSRFQYKPSFEEKMLDKWKSGLKQLNSLSEVTSLELMSDFGLPVVQHCLAENLEQVVLAADELGYPLVMKTAEPGIHHKSDYGGVIVSISDQSQLENSYSELQQKLGDRVLIMPMISGGIEVSVGMKNDPNFGPLIIVASGGVLIELIGDRAYAIAPLDMNEAEIFVRKLKLSKLFDGVRGQPPVDKQALIYLIHRFSGLAFELSDSIQEIDLNPIIVSEKGCQIVDALVISGS